METANEGLTYIAAAKDLIEKYCQEKDVWDSEYLNKSVQLLYDAIDILSST